ncbi:MAG: hypothetical protein ABIK62_03190 [candidate division WOR-3 bacterium]
MANQAGRSLTVIDAGRNSVVTTVQLPGASSSLEYNPASNKVYCGLRDSSRVAVVDGASSQIVALVQARSVRACRADSVANIVFCAIYPDTVLVLDGLSNQVAAAIRVGDQPWALDMNPIDRRSYVANHSGSSVSVLRSAPSVWELTP